MVLLIATTLACLAQADLEGEAERPGFAPSPEEERRATAAHTYLDWVVDPMTHPSANGVWECHTTPFQRSGPGPSLVRLSKDGRELWELEVPLSLPFVATSDRGHVIACGVTQSWFEVWLFTPDGEAKIVQRIRPTHSPRAHSPDLPWVKGIFVQEELDRFTLHLWGYEEGWLSYRLSDGEPLWRRSRESRAEDLKEASSFPWMSEPVPRPVDTVEAIELELLGESSFETTTRFGLRGGTLLDEPAGIVDPLGRVLVVDLRLPAIEIFDPNGRWLDAVQGEEAFRRGSAHPYMFSSLLAVQVDALGGLHLGEGDRGFHTYVHADCGWVEESDLGPLASCFVPGSESYWQWDADRGIHLFDGDGAIQLTIPRGPGGRWLRQVHTLAANRRGALAVLEGDHAWLSPEAGLGESLLAYDERGELTRSWVLPDGLYRSSLARSEDWIVCVDGHLVLLAHPASGRLMQFETEGHEMMCLGLGAGFVNDGTELCIVHPMDGTIRRYALPLLAEDDAQPSEGR